MKEHRRYLAHQSVNSRTKSTTSGHVDLSPSAAWPQRRGVSGMRAISLGGDRTGTGVFLPRSVDRTSPVTAQTRNKPSKFF